MKTFEELFKAWPEKVRPLIKNGLDNETQLRYQEALDLPVVFDSRRSLNFLRPMDLTSESFVRDCNHYAGVWDGISQLSRLLNIPLSEVEEQPFSMLGYSGPRHHAVEEFGLTMTIDKPFSQVVVQAAIKLIIYRIKQSYMIDGGDEELGIPINDYTRITASFPRGKNSGLPLMASGSDRLFNNITMALNARLATHVINGYPLDQLYEGLLHHYVVFSRYQRTAREVPLHLDIGSFTTKNLEPRRRIINSTPKVAAMVLKPLMKWLTVRSIMRGEMSQDRTDLKQRIQKAAHVQAYDASRFDLRSGGLKLNQGLKVIEEVYKHFAGSSAITAVIDVLYKEATFPTLVDVGLQNQILVSSDKDSIKSGSASTSRVGSIINLMYDMTITSLAEGLSSPEQIFSYYVSHQPSAILGDDLIKFFPDLKSKQRYTEKLPALFDTVGMKIEEEHPTKFLGYLINHPSTNGSNLRSMSHTLSPLISLFLPERSRQNATASFLARYLYLIERDSEAVLHSITKLMTDDTFLLSVHKKFLDTVYPILRTHYLTHPNGAMRMMFLSYPKEPDVSPVMMRKNIMVGVDEILYSIAKGSQEHFNFKLLGLPEQFDDREDVVNTTLENAADHDEIVTKETLSSIYKLKDTRKRDRAFTMIQIFSESGAESFVRRWRASLPVIARRIDSPFGEAFRVNL